ncbi:hypothetical protein [Roseibium suaedae]|uniref:hypothetical protein n=1 Tax=Roseibium suaedae TaxID=735517 RepID=UPI000932980A|nr:hypothetical protein [Roseibium suaedae]
MGDSVQGRRTALFIKVVFRTPAPLKFPAVLVTVNQDINRPCGCLSIEAAFDKPVGDTAHDFIECVPIADTSRLLDEVEKRRLGNIVPGRASSLFLTLSVFTLTFGFLGLTLLERRARGHASSWDMKLDLGEKPRGNYFRGLNDVPWVSP